MADKDDDKKKAGNIFLIILNYSVWNNSLRVRTGEYIPISTERLKNVYVPAKEGQVKIQKYVNLKLYSALKLGEYKPISTNPLQQYERERTNWKIHQGEKTKWRMALWQAFRMRSGSRVHIGRHFEYISIVMLLRVA